ncbi:MAG TPA: hypothetical protein VE338_11065 [Ktedonobacterales bacterium]|jgi:hypothetical protein|nr:hypothetical protein [Ktedonobacterales bacterium]
MYMHPDLMGQVAKDHQLQLLREAEVERQVKLAHVDSPSLSMRMRQSVGALLLRMGRSIQPRNAARTEARGV